MQLQLLPRELQADQRRSRRRHEADAMLCCGLQRARGSARMLLRRLLLLRLRLLWRRLRAGRARPGRRHVWAACAGILGLGGLAAGGIPGQLEQHRRCLELGLLRLRWGLLCLLLRLRLRRGRRLLPLVLQLLQLPQPLHDRPAQQVLQGAAGLGRLQGERPQGGLPAMPGLEARPQAGPQLH